MRHTVIISDIHLSEVERGDGLWMRYRQRSFLPDEEIAAMLATLCAEIRGEELTLILNGDICDLDAPRVIEDRSVFHDLPRTAEHTVPALAAILDEHPVFVAALGRVLAAGHRLVIISGNHDAGLSLPEARALFAARLLDAARAVVGDWSDQEEERVASRITFRAWFHLSEDGIVVEHGHQYDRFCSHRYPMTPFGERTREIKPTMGSIGTRRLIAPLGFFNPHDERSLPRSSLGYIAHWARHYLFSSRSIAAIWLGGTTRVIAELARRREAPRSDRLHADLIAAAKETGAPLAHVKDHARLFAVPVDERLADVARELWIDRVIVALCTISLAAVLAIFFHGAFAWLGLSAPLFVAVYERVAPPSSVRASYLGVSRVMRAILEIHQARAVVFGHTHIVEGAWEDDAFVGNPGSWSAIADEGVSRDRHVVWLRSDAGAPLAGGLYKWEWDDGRFEARAVAGELLLWHEEREHHAGE